MTEYTEGRRRASVEADTRVAPFGNDFPEHAPQNVAATGPAPRAIADAFAYATDRLDRLDHLVGSLQGTAQRLGHQLEPALTDGTYGRPTTPGDTTGADPMPEDRRSTIAKRITTLGQRADTLADWVAQIERTLEDLSDALEV